MYVRCKSCLMKVQTIQKITCNFREKIKKTFQKTIYREPDSIVVHVAPHYLVCVALPREVCNVIGDKQWSTAIDPRLTPQREITLVNVKVVYSVCTFCHLTDMNLLENIWTMSRVTPISRVEVMQPQNISTLKWGPKSAFIYFQMRDTWSTLQGR